MRERRLEYESRNLENTHRDSMARLEARVERILAGEGMVGTIWLRLEFLKETVLPPFTGRVTRALLFKARCLQALARKYSNKPHLRPVSLGVLRTPEGRLLYRREGEKKPLLKARAGEELLTRVSFYTRNPSLSYDLLPSCSETVDLGYTRLYVETSQISVEHIHPTAPAEREWSVKLSIATPLLLSAKLLSPPFPSFTPLTHQTRHAYRLLPTPGYVIASATRLWMGLVKNSPGRRAVYLMGRLATITIAEADYRLRPETALYGKDEEGKTLRVRGVKGYVILTPLHPLAKRFMPPLLTLAKHMGLGKSRGIGFGEVMVEYLQDTKAKGGEHAAPTPQKAPE